jgi:Skp family chaperone for outer membrane proteins
MRFPLNILACAASACLLSTAVVPHEAVAQTAGNGWFVPPAQQPAAQEKPAKTSARVRPSRTVPVAASPLPEPDTGTETQDQPQGPPPNLPKPPVPTLGPLPKEPPPPPIVLAVLGVPDVMQQSNAAQIIQRVIGARREKLRAEVERAQATWRELEQRLQNDAPHLTPDQGRARERELRERVAADRRALQEKNRIIQEAGQVALNQIERTLSIIVQRVSEAHGINMVLHHSNVVLNMPQFDITEECVVQLNKLLPTVQIPPENVDPATLPASWGTPASTATAASTH